MYYTNPRGLARNQGCCEPESAFEGVCSFENTCDTEFVIRVQNFDRLTQIGGDAIVLGVYQDTNTIRFSPCGVLLGSITNPLVFIFPRADFSQWVSTYRKVSYTHQCIITTGDSPCNL